MDCLAAIYIVFLIYFIGVFLSMLYILFWNMDCHSDFSNRMKEIDIGNSFKSWYFFVTKNKTQNY